MNRRGIVCGLTGLLVVALFGLVIDVFETGILDGQEADRPVPPATTTPPAAADSRELPNAIAAALDRAGDWEFNDAALKQVVEHVQAVSQIEVLIDARALDDFGIAADTPITCHVKGISLRAFLRIALRPLELTYEIRDGALWITTPEMAESRLSTRVYPAADLARVSDEPGEDAYDYDSLIQLITTTLAPDSWDYVGGPGAIDSIYGSLIVSQTADIHERLTQFLARYRQVVRQYKEQPAGPGAPIFLNQAAWRERIQAALEKPVSWNVQDTPLSDAVDVLAETSGIPIVIDHRSLEESGIDSGVVVSSIVKELPLRLALRRLLEPHDLTWAVRDEVLAITAMDSGYEGNDVCLYPVYDLVLPEGATGREDADFDTLIRVLTGTVAPDSWDDVGGPGTIEPIVVPPALVISQSETIHDQLRAMLQELRQARQLERESRKTQTKGKPQLTIQTYAIRPGYQAQEVLRLIVGLLGEDAFTGEGVVVQVLGNDLVVRHNRRGHQRIWGVLSQLQNSPLLEVPGGGGFGDSGGGQFGGGSEDGSGGPFGGGGTQPGGSGAQPGGSGLGNRGGLF